MEEKRRRLMLASQVLASGNYGPNFRDVDDVNSELRSSHVAPCSTCGCHSLHHSYQCEAMSGAIIDETWCSNCGEGLITCPNCGSKNSDPEPSECVFCKQQTWYCRDCGHTWDDPPHDPTCENRGDDIWCDTCGEYVTTTRYYYDCDKCLGSKVDWEDRCDSCKNTLYKYTHTCPASPTYWTCPNCRQTFSPKPKNGDIVDCAACEMDNADAFFCPGCAHEYCASCGAEIPA